MARGDRPRAVRPAPEGSLGPRGDRSRVTLDRFAGRPRDPRVRPRSYRWTQTRRDERSGHPDGARAGDDLERLASRLWRAGKRERRTGGQGSEEASKKAGRQAASRWRSDDDWRTPREAPGSLHRRENSRVSEEPLARYCERRRCLVGPRAHRAAERKGRNTPCGSGSGALWK